MKHTLAAILALALLSLAGAWTRAPQPEAHSPPTPDAPAAPSFQAFDIFIDAGADPLAAYQIELKDLNSSAKIVGIEGGEPGAYSPAPYYDPRAMQLDHVIIGALSTADAAQLPHARTRIARIHTLAAATPPRWEAVVMTAGSPRGGKLSATVKVQPATDDPAANNQGAGK